MQSWILIVLTMGGYIIAYHTYGKYIAKKIFKLNPNAPVPSKTQFDGKEYVPSDKQIMFGHHFTSIAGTGPIVGPAIGIIWGWVPAIIWVFFGSIFIGAVHDFSALIISVRHQGKSIAHITGELISPRVKIVFFILIALALWIVIAIFGLIIALIFARFPESVLPIWLEIPIAIIMGHLVFQKKWGLIKTTLISVAVMYITIGIGVWFPITLPTIGFLPATGIWTIILLTYAFIASILPVPILLQPRDFLNAWQLYVSLGLIIVGIIAINLNQSLPIHAPAFNLNPIGAPPMWPFLCITIACGAISGFHCLVCSGTSSKQLANETDATFVGFGSMLTEGALAVIIILAVTAGIGLGYAKNGEILTGLSAWQTHYGSWQASAGLSSKLEAVVIGCANFMKGIGIPVKLGIAIIGVFIASFAGTTLDSATRIQRYIITELTHELKLTKISASPIITTAIAVITALALAFSTGLSGKGALNLWPLFGAINQLLGALALLVATVYLKKHTPKAMALTGIPCILLLIMTILASLINQINFFQNQLWLLSFINIIVTGLSIIIVVESIIQMRKVKIS